MKKRKNRNILVIAYLLLVGFSLIFILFHGINSILLEEIIKGTADPFGLMVFLLMGLYPLYFLVSNFILEREMTKSDWILTFLSFMIGAFALVPSYFKPYMRKDRPHSTLPTLMAWFGLGSSMMILVYGFMVGDSLYYSAQFMSDPLVFIMTLDFITLTLLSILISREHSVGWKFAFFPLVGWWAILLD
jgi:hypothetical protein